MELLDGYTPELGDEFGFLLASDGATGAFDEFLFPVFDGLTFDLDTDPDGNFRLTVAAVPVSAALPLFLTALAGLGLMARRKRAG